MVSFSESSLISLAASSLLVTLASATGQVVGDITCLDAYSCKNETLESSTNLYCVGYYACTGSNISVDGIANCAGDHGCYDTVIAGAEEVRCEGNYGCGEAKITDAGDEFYVTGAAGFYDGVITDDGADLMVCDGYYSCWDAEVYNVPTLYVKSFYGFTYGEIDSEDLEALNVYFLGLHASYGASVYCRNGSNCELVCGSYYGCTSDTTMYCYDGSECDYDCDDCAYDSCPTVYDESDDSTWKYIHSNVQTFDEFVKINQGIKDKERNEISLKREEYLPNDISGDSMFLKWLRDYMALVNDNDDGTIVMSSVHGKSNVAELKTYIHNRRYKNAAFNGVSTSHSKSNLFNYNVVQIAALSSVLFAVIIGVIYWRYDTRNNEIDYQKI